MTSALRGSNLVQMDIAGLGMDLIFTDPELAVMVNERYRFYPPAVEKRFRSEIVISSQLPAASLLSLPLKFDAGILQLEATGCRGYIDPHQQRGQLFLNAAHPLEEIEYFLRMVSALVAFESGGLFFHTAGVLRNGRAYLFFGTSGSGKTTVAQLSAQDEVINDDLVLLLPSPYGWLAHATPFWNDYRMQPPPAPGQVAGLFRLVQDQKVYLEPASRAHTVAEMIGSVPVVSADLGRSLVLLQRCQSILDSIPAYRLHFLKDASFWQAIDEAFRVEN